jgi:hypothetical protein
MGAIREKPALAVILLIIALVALALSLYFTTRPSAPPLSAPAEPPQAGTAPTVPPTNNTGSQTVPY